MNAPPIKAMNRDHLKPYKISGQKNTILSSVLSHRGTNRSPEPNRQEDNNSEEHDSEHDWHSRYVDNLLLNPGATLLHNEEPSLLKQMIKEEQPNEASNLSMPIATNVRKTKISKPKEIGKVASVEITRPNSRNHDEYSSRR